VITNYFVARCYDLKVVNCDNVCFKFEIASVCLFIMFSIFSNRNKKNTIQSKSDHSDSETIDDPGPSTSSS